MITRIIAFARGLMRRRKIDDEIVEELQDHIEREIEMHRSRGASLDDARRMALRDLGGLTQTITHERTVQLANPGDPLTSCTSQRWPTAPLQVDWTTSTPEPALLSRTARHSPLTCIGRTS